MKKRFRHFKNKYSEKRTAQQKFSLWKEILYLIFFSVILFFALETMLQNPFAVRVPIIFLNIVINFAVLLFLSALFANHKIAVYVYTGILWIFGLTNYLVIAFRSTPLMPWDIYSARTALHVVDNYKMTFTKNFIISCILFITIILLCHFSARIKHTKTAKRILVLASVLLLFFTLQYCRSDKAVKTYRLNTILFNSKVMSERNGHLLNFVFCTRYLDVEKPENYQTGKAAEILAENKPIGQSVEPEVKPDIVVIMDESFSDLQNLKEFTTNQDYLPFYRSFEQNTKKGILYASVIGGNTATSEFEFLTGMSMGFLPSGSIAYLQFIHSPISSLVSYLESFNYQTTAMHPYYKSGWNREKVYEYFGFDQVKFNKEFIHQEKVRNYISDQALFDEILLELENKEQPQFIFSISMQNHGGYTDLFDNFTPDVAVTSEQSSPALDQYLSLLKKTDEALKNFIQQISQRQKPTIVLFFGDHQPNDYTVSPLTQGMPQDLLQENRRKADYVLWANFPLKGNDSMPSPIGNDVSGNDTSINYLALDLLEQAGLPLDNWYQLLANTRIEYPILDDAFYFDQNLKKNEISGKQLPKMLNDYAIVQYDYLNHKDFSDLR